MSAPQLTCTANLSASLPEAGKAFELARAALISRLRHARCVLGSWRSTADGEKGVVAGPPTTAARRRPFSGKIRRVSSGAAPSCNDDFASLAFDYAISRTAGRAHDVDDASEGRRTRG